MAQKPFGGIPSSHGKENRFRDFSLLLSSAHPRTLALISQILIPFTVIVSLLMDFSFCALFTFFSLRLLRNHLDDFKNKKNEAKSSCMAKSSRIVFIAIRQPSGAGARSRFFWIFSINADYEFGLRKPTSTLHGRNDELFTSGKVWAFQENI